MESSTTNSPFSVRHERDALIVSFASPARTLSWAVLNGGFCHAHHIINHHVNGNDGLFCAQPSLWLERAAGRPRLQGEIVGMATAAEKENPGRVSMASGNVGAPCFAPVGYGNALSVADAAPGAN